MPRGLIISTFFLLPGFIFTQEEPFAIYVPVEGKRIVLNGSDIPAGGTAVWDWRPHRGEPSTKALVEVKAVGHGWRAEWLSEGLKSNGPRWHRINDSRHLTIEKAAFEAAGLFTLRQTEPERKILKQHEIFLIKVERDPRYQYLGSDVTFSCTISRLPDTVSLHWTEKESSRNKRNNTDQIQLNNTVYLIVRDAQTQDKERYACEIQAHGRTVLTVDIELYLSLSIFGKEYTSFLPIFGDNPLYLNCKVDSNYNHSAWHWKSYNDGKQRRVMSSDDKRQRDTSIPELWNRISLQDSDGRSFPLQISPAEFEDAGNYTCTMDTAKVVTVELMTTKLTVIPSRPLAEGESVTLTCSVSHLREATRLIWMETGRKSFVKEKTFDALGEGNFSLSLFIQKIGQHNRRWTCLVFNRKMPRIFITIQLDDNEQDKIAYFNLILIAVVPVLLCLIAAMITYQRRIHKPVNEDQREPEGSQTIPNSERCTEEMHYAAVRYQKRPVDEDQREPDSEPYTEEIQYAAVRFQKRPVNEDQREPEGSRTIPNSEPYPDEIQYAAVRFQKRPESTGFR
ncbi:uncharacterized protein LOC127570087 isoform X2 [Pristis pectinata]|uniref:uncharacterized protein LOC127570087 isoform X2 n=1 Tax=Pristis pectinata TaxID=685728 RepID=UPI00223CE64E|nr:uncharacterized protein LOC127570087 isoform X2 [Pristis pectinata]